MAQFARPTSDVSAGGFTPNGGGSLASMIDEASPVDSIDVIASNTGSVTDTCRVNLGSVTDPLQSVGHTIRFRARRSSGAGGHAEIRLLSGGTLIATLSSAGSITSSFQTFSYTLSGAETDAITNYADLDFEIFKNNNGFNMQVEVSWAEFEVPDPTQTLTPAGFANVSAFGTPTLTGQNTMTPAGFANTSAFGTVTMTDVLLPNGFANASAFGTPTFTPGPVTLTPGGFANASAFGTPRLDGQISPRGFANVSAFGTPRYQQPGKKFYDLATKSRGRKILIVEIFGPWFVLGEMPGRYCTHHFQTRPDDPDYSGLLANHYFVPRIKSGFTVKRSLVNGNLLRGRSVPDGGTFNLLNLDGGLTGMETDLKGFSLKARLGSDGWYLGDFKTIFDGLVEEVTPSRDGKTMQIKYADFGRTLKKPLQTLTYRGLGQAVRLDGTTNTRVKFASKSGFIAASSVGFEAYIRLFASGNQSFLSHGGLTTGNAVLFQNGDGTISFRVRSAGGVNTTATSASSLPVGWEGHIGGQWDGTELQVYIDGVPDGAPVAFAGAIQTTANDLFVGASATTNWANCWITEIRQWVDVVRTDDQIFANRWRELAADDSTGLALYAKTNEGALTSAWDDLHNYEGLFEGAAAWTSTKTGGAELAGKYLPTSWGFVWHRDAVQVDGISRIYQVHHRQIAALDGVFEGGRKLAPLYSFVEGRLAYDSTRKRIYLGIPDPWEIGLPLPIGPFMPFAPGQMVTLTGGIRAGHYTVSAVDEYGAWVEVVESLATGSDVGTSVTVATKSGTHEYIPSLSDGTFQLLANPSKPITARLRGDAVGGFAWTVPGIMARMFTDMAGQLSSQINGSLGDVETLYPWEACYATGIEREDIEAIFSKLATSIGGNWGYTIEAAELDLVVYKEPEENPSPLDRLDLSKAELLTFSRLRSVQPVKKTVAQYRPNFRPLTFDELTGSVQQDQTARGQAHRQDLMRDWLKAEYVPPPQPIVADAGNVIAEAEDSLNCYLLRSSHADQVAFEQHVLYGVQREVFEATVKLQPYLVDHRRCTVFATHDGYNSTKFGKGFRIVSMEGGTKKVKLEIWG